jgi:hypothetical protein
VAALVRMRRSTRHWWVVRYLTGQLGGDEPSHLPGSSPRQVAEAVEFAVVGCVDASAPAAITGRSTRRSERVVVSQEWVSVVRTVGGGSVDVPPRTRPSGSVI